MIKKYSFLLATLCLSAHSVSAGNTWSSSSPSLWVAPVVAAVNAIRIWGAPRPQDNEARLLLAARHGRLLAVEHLLSVERVDVNAQDTDGDTALMLASQNGHLDVVEALLAIDGIDVNHQNLDGTTALIRAIQFRRENIARRLLALDHIDINLQEVEDAHTALSWAQLPELHDIINLISARKDLVNATSSFDGSHIILQNTYHRDDSETVIDLVNNSGQVSDQQIVLFFESIIEDNSEVSLEKLSIIKSVLATGEININQRYKNGYTALILAARKGQLDLINIILMLLPDISLFADNGQTALIVAVENNYLSIVQRLIEYAREIGDLNQLMINAFDRQGNTALIRASQIGSLEIVDLLLGVEGIDVLSENNQNQNALQVAQDKGFIDIVNRLSPYSKTAFLSSSSSSSRFD